MSEEQLNLDQGCPHLFPTIFTFLTELLRRSTKQTVGKAVNMGGPISVPLGRKKSTYTCVPNTVTTEGIYSYKAFIININIYLYCGRIADGGVREYVSFLKKSLSFFKCIFLITCKYLQCQEWSKMQNKNCSKRKINGQISLHNHLASLALPFHNWGHGA